MAEALDYSHAAHISGFESGKREPSLPLIVRYAELAGCSTDYLIDDRLELPMKRCKRIAR
jgi:transcriptional regulator with XRE-family HTH domain